VRTKGTIDLLAEWLTTVFRPLDRKPIDDASAAFREVRRLRNKPAHSLHRDEFDLSYFEQQRELMLRAYWAVKVIRLVLSVHPDARGTEIPPWIREGEIYPL